jgi:holliday junction DNA helicase RuvB
MGLDRIVSPNRRDEDISSDASLHPQRLTDYIGQERLKENLGIAIDAALSRGEPLDHILLYGPPGLGKTSMANVIAHEMNVSIKTTSGPAIERKGDLAAILTNLHQGDVLFIDEVHRLNREVEEALNLAMEDFVLDIIIGKGPSARSLHLTLPRFTLIGATAHMTSSLRDRFGVIHKLEFYDEPSMREIVRQKARMLNVSVDAEGQREIATRARGTPRVAIRLLKRTRDYAHVRADGNITREVAREALQMLQIDEFGLDQVDRKILETIIDKYNGGPVRLAVLAALIGEEANTIMDDQEPYMQRLGLLKYANHGVTATRRAYDHLGLPPPAQSPEDRLL